MRYVKIWGMSIDIIALSILANSFHIFDIIFSRFLFLGSSINLSIVQSILNGLNLFEKIESMAGVLFKLFSQYYFDG